MDFASGGELSVGLVGFEGAHEQLGVRAYEDGVDDMDWEREQREFRMRERELAWRQELELWEQERTQRAMHEDAIRAGRARGSVRVHGRLGHVLVRAACGASVVEPGTEGEEGGGRSQD